MNFSKIRLNNERNSHVTKRLNRLNTWNFFKVLYRENIWRLFGFNLIVLLCLAPLLAMMIIASMQSTALQQIFPVLNSFGFSTGVWENMAEEFANQLREHKLFYGLLTAASSVLVSLVLSGGFAVIRDAFWTGKLSAVGVLKSIGKGIKANYLYALASTILIAFSIFGIYALYLWLSVVTYLWLAIVITVVLGIVDMMFCMYLLILCSVSVTYKQTLVENLDDSRRLLWLNVLPNLVHFMLMIVPVALYFLFSGSMLQSLFMVLLLMFGGMYLPLVWQTHMMRTFALFHPIEAKKKKNVHQTKQKPQDLEDVSAGASNNADSKGKRNSKKTDVIAQGEISDDVYALSDDAYSQDDNT